MRSVRSQKEAEEIKKEIRQEEKIVLVDCNPDQEEADYERSMVIRKQVFYIPG